jgi:LmbE family N-acetylglucosaminyl deacetylase
MSSVIVISPHPDDETLGCGGTLLKHNKNNDDLYWLIITRPVEENYSKNFIQKRELEIEKVKSKYKFTKTFQLNYQSAKLDKILTSDLISDIGDVFKQINPEIIYLPFRNDIHTDHKYVFDAVLSCTKSFRYPSIRKVLIYETLSETEFAPSLTSNAFQPNCFSDISSFMEEKVEIMKVYESEMGEHPFPRSERNIKALATYRGATAGVEYAEAFMILKEIF